MIGSLPLRSLAGYPLRQKVKALPGVLSIYLRVFNRSGRPQLATTSSMMCMEGFPRSGNSFSYRCVVTLLGVPDQAIAHHTHSPANVWRAIRRNLPTYVFVRQPMEACISLILYGACDTLEESLQAYEDFYRPLVSLLDRIVVVPFEDLVASPAAFLNRVADDLGLERIDWSGATAALMEDVIRRADEQFHVENYDRNSLPSREKDRRKAEIAGGELSTGAKARLRRCTALREKILETAAQVVPPR